MIRSACCLARISSGKSDEFWDADQVVGGDSEGEDSFNLGPASQFDLGKAAGFLHPAEDFFDALAAALADGVAGMAQCPLINRGDKVYH